MIFPGTPLLRAGLGWVQALGWGKTDPKQHFWTIPRSLAPTPPPLPPSPSLRGRWGERVTASHAMRTHGFSRTHNHVYLRQSSTSFHGDAMLRIASTHIPRPPLAADSLLIHLYSEVWTASLILGLVIGSLVCRRMEVCGTSNEQRGSNSFPEHHKHESDQKAKGQPSPNGRKRSNLTHNSSQ